MPCDDDDDDEAKEEAAERCPARAGLQAAYFDKETPIIAHVDMVVVVAGLA